MTDELNENGEVELDDDAYGEEDMEDASLDDTSFDLEDEYKEDPLAPQGTYNGIIKNVEFSGKNNAIVWTAVATANPGMMMLDGTIPVDGTEYKYYNWLPKKGDEKIPSKGGKSNKRQVKINMLKQFQDDMEVDMNTPQKVKQALEDSEWIGISVTMGIGIDSYQGRTRNTVNSMKRSEEEFDMPEPADIVDIDGDDIPY